MSADLYRVIALTAGNDETACEAAFVNANTVLALTKIAPPFVNLLKPGTGFALYRPISGDGTAFGIAKAVASMATIAPDTAAERDALRAINAELLGLLQRAVERLEDEEIADLFCEEVRAFIAKTKGGAA